MLAWEYLCVCGRGATEQIDTQSDVLQRPVCSACGTVQKAPRMVVLIRR